LGELDVGGSLPLLVLRVRDLARRPPATLGAEAPVRAAARLMAAENVGSVLVTDASGVAIGIVTDRDLRRRVLAESRDPDTPLRLVMSSPLATIPPDALAFEALLEMTRRNVHHLAVVDGDRLLSVLSSGDFLPLQTTHPVALAREIESGASLADLRTLVPRITRLVAVLARAGTPPPDIGRVVAELNDRVVRRVLALVEARLEQAGQPPPAVPWAWLALGSEGRREQTLLTDQDNALVFADVEDPAARAAAGGYFQTLARETVGALVELGFPPCPGGWMASDPRWCQPLSGWLASFDRWIRAADVSVLAASICFDLRVVVGDSTLAAALWAAILAPSAERRIFLRHLAKDVVRRPPALGFLGRFRANTRGAVDLKQHGTFPVVGAARVLALEMGSDVTNTVERLRAVGLHGLLTPAIVAAVTEAYSFVLRLRLAHQLERIEAGHPADNQVDPRRLSHADRVGLRDALRAVEQIRAVIRDRYLTDEVP
jgi:CBS domain-containing protein